MSYIATIGDHSYKIEAGEAGQTRMLKLDGETRTLDWHQLAPLAADAKGNVSAGGRYSLLIAGRSYDVLARRITKAGQKVGETYEIHVLGRRFEVMVEDERARLLAGLARGGAAGGAATINAPMPGLVIGVPFEPGAQVEQGQTVVVLEAMKMENDLAAPISGVIKEIRVSKGQTVDQGEVLVIVASDEQ